MRNKMQMSLFDIYNDVSEAVEKKKPKLIALLEEHIDFQRIIPASFYHAFSLATAETIFIISKTTSKHCFCKRSSVSRQTSSYLTY